MLFNCSISSQKYQFSQDKVDYFADSIISLTFASKKVLSCYLRYSRNYKQIFVSQLRVAKECGVSLRTVNSSIALLKKLKFIKSTYRHKQTSVYTINPWFKKEANWDRIKHLFYTIKTYISTNLLLSKNYSIRTVSNCVAKIFKDSSSWFLTKFLKQSKSKYRESYNVDSSDIGIDFDQKKEMSMEEVKKFIESKMTRALRELTILLGLSKWGQITLIIFPELVLEQVLNDLKRAKNVQNPFGFVFKRAKDYCKQHGIDVPWGAYYALREALKMPENAPMTLQRETAKPQLSTDSRRVKPNALLEKNYAVRTQPPHEEPEDIIYHWEVWMDNPENDKARALFGIISPHVREVLQKRLVPDAEIERLYAKYPPLQMVIEGQPEPVVADAKPQGYTDLKSVIATLLGGGNETIHSQRGASTTPSILSSPEGNGFPQKNEPGHSHSSGGSTQRGTLVQGAFDFGSEFLFDHS